MSQTLNEKPFRFLDLAADNGLNAWVNLGMKRNFRDGWGKKKAENKA